MYNSIRAGGVRSKEDSLFMGGSRLNSVRLSGVVN